MKQLKGGRVYFDWQFPRVQFFVTRKVWWWEHVVKAVHIQEADSKTGSGDCM